MPAFFGNQANRLQRERWADPSELADELFAMFTSDSPLSADVPITLIQNGDTPAITVKNQAGDTIFTTGGGDDGGDTGGDTGTPTDLTELIKAIQRLTKRVEGLERFIDNLMAASSSGVLGGTIASYSGAGGVYSVTFDTNGQTNDIQQLHFRDDGPGAPAGMKVNVYYYQTASNAPPRATDSQLEVTYLTGDLPQFSYQYWMLFPTWWPPPESPP